MKPRSSRKIITGSATNGEIPKGVPTERADEPTSDDDRRSKQNTKSNVDPSFQPRALRLKDASRMYGLSVSTLNKMIKPGGDLRSVFVGGRRLVPVDAMEALIFGKEPPAP
jgi:hypothetical protein